MHWQRAGLQGYTVFFSFQNHEQIIAYSEYVTNITTRIWLYNSVDCNVNASTKSSLLSDWENMVIERKLINTAEETKLHFTTLENKNKKL
jgi:hypothetical protein